MLKYKFLIIFLFLFNAAFSAIVGRPCFHKFKKMNGICKSNLKCPTVKDDRAKGVPYQKCKFPTIVCCVETKVIGEKSTEMCKKYENLTYTWNQEPTLVGSENLWIKESICPWDNVGLTVIYGGVKASLGEFPHMALIGYGKTNDISWLCGGTLVSEKFVLTAAHCLYAKTHGRARLIRLGDLNYTDSTDDEYTQIIPIKTIHKHPYYKYPATYHDIALIRLKYDAELSLYVRPACLYTKEVLPVKEVIASGWGFTENDELSDYLLKTTLDIFNLDKCARVYGINRYFPTGLQDNVQMCFGSLKSVNDTCPGDSGGPIQIYNNDFHCSYYIVGITCHGKKCGLTNIPSIYVRVQPYIDWIENTVWS